jgi:MYXO-CTERM domain-containing protein
MRRSLALAALSTAALALPAAARAQGFTTRVDLGVVSGVQGFGTFTTGASSTTGCGVYACLRVLLGPAASAPGSSPAFGLEARVASLLLTPAFDALGAASYSYVAPGSTSYTLQGTSALGRPVFDGDLGSLLLDGGSGRPLGVATGFLVSPTMVGAVSGVAQFALSTSGAFEFRAFAADGRVLASETIVANVSVTPEPATLALAGAGVVLLGAWARRHGIA